MLRTSSIVARVMVAALVGAARLSVAQGAAAPADTTLAAPGDSLRAITVQDSLGLPGTLRGQTVGQDPAAIKAMLQRMGSNEVPGRTAWERKKNPRVAMLCSALLPGLGQTYNGRRLKVGVMVGFASYYMGNGWLNWKRYEAAIARRDATDPDSRAFKFENNLAAFYKEEARTYLWWSGATWLLGLIDSWIDAHLYDVRAYTPPAADVSLPSGVNDRTSYLTVGFGLELSKQGRSGNHNAP